MKLATLDMRNIFRKRTQLFNWFIDGPINDVIEPREEYPLYIQKQFDMNVIAAINSYREQKKLTKLIVFTELADVAYSHSEYMAAKGISSHDFAVQRQSHFIGNEIAELVDDNFQSAESVVLSWINTEKGNEVLLNPDNLFIGVATDFDGKSKRYVTALFMN